MIVSVLMFSLKFLIPLSHKTFSIAIHLNLEMIPLQKSCFGGVRPGAILKIFFFACFALGLNIFDLGSI